MLRKRMLPVVLLIAAIAPLRAVGAVYMRKPVQELSSFEVATIKPTVPGYRGGKFITMPGAHRYIARNYTLKEMVGAAYDLPLTTISGGPDWINSDPYDIDAATPGDSRPNPEQQRAMLRALLADRFKLVVHRVERAAGLRADRYKGWRQTEGKRSRVARGSHQRHV